MDVTILINTLAIIIGLGLLWWAGDTAVHQVVLLTSAWNVSAFFFGFVVLAIAGNVPELSVALAAVFSDASQMAAGDLIGANFSDIVLALGMPLCFSGITQGTLSPRDSKRLLFVLGLNAAVMAGIMGLGFLTRFIGLGLVLVYVGVIAWAWAKHRTFFVAGDEIFHPAPEVSSSIIVLIAKFIVSFCVVIGASMLVVQNAIAFAAYTNIPQETIGATILSLGTSLPELTLGIHSLRRGECALVLGATLGAVLGQSTLILGILAMLSHTIIDVRPLRMVTAFTFVAFALLAHAIHRRSITRITGIMLSTLFIGYLLLLFL